MRRLLGLALALSGCLKPSSKQCSQGWACPSGLDCVDPPTFCASKDEATACSAGADFSACTTMTGSGYCQGHACQPCIVDYAVCPAPPWSAMTYMGPDLVSVAVPAPGTAIAVGAGSIAQWDGLSWTTKDIASPDTLRWLALPPGGGDAWLISTTKLYRWDGSALATAYTAATTSMTSVWAASPTDIYAVGTAGVVIHGDGTTFTPTMLPSSTRTLFDVAGSSSNDVYAVGQVGTLVHLEAGTWVQKTLPASAATTTLRAVWSDSPSDVFAAGNTGTILHFDGTAWTVSPTSPEIAMLTLHSLWGSGPSDVYAIGNSGTGSSIIHFDGTMWTTQQAVPVALSAGAGAGAHELIAVGPNQTVLRSTAP